MKKTSLVILLTAFFIAACDWDIGTGQSFDYDLQGTWVSNDYANATYSGKLIISHDRITIIGYGEDQKLPPEEGDDEERPFKGFTKGTALKGYSEDGKIFIEDGGQMQVGIPYSYWDDSPPPDYRKVKFLRFTFGGRPETLEYSLNVP